MGKIESKFDIDEKAVGSEYVPNFYWNLVKEGKIKKILEEFEKGNLDCYKVIVEPSGHTVAHQAIILDRRDLFKFCNVFGVDWDNPDRNGVTPLMKAAALNRLFFLSQLLQNGANKDLKDKKGRTALDYAILYKNRQVQNLLNGQVDLQNYMSPNDLADQE